MNNHSDEKQNINNCVPAGSNPPISTGNLGSIFQSPQFRNAVDRASIPDLWEQFDLPDSPARSCRSPFREDCNPSFSAYQKGTSWRFKDHGCPEHAGDAYEFFLLAARKEKSAASAQEFVELVAAQPNAAAAGNHEWRHRMSPRPNQAATPDFSAQAAEFSANLRGDAAMQELIAAELGVMPCTIGMLAEEGSLGFSPANQGTTVHTPHGILVRKPEGRKQNLPGSSMALWRGEFAHKAGQVILTEGSSDAIAAIDAGLEHDGTTAVVALPSASTSFQEPGIEALTGKDVILIPDRDEAGGRMAMKAKETLAPMVRSLRIFAWHIFLKRHPDLLHSNVKDLRDLHANLGRGAIAELIQTCCQAVDPDDSSSGACCSTTDDDIPVEPLSSSFLDVMNKEVEVDDELIQHGFLRKGQSMVIVAPSGVGKSSFTMQTGVCFALGNECLGFRPPRPLKVLLIQSENDEADQKEVAQGVFRGLGITESQLEILRHRFFFRESQDSGNEFLDGIFRKLLRERNPDLVILDPYGDYQTDTANNEQQVKAFLVKLRQIIKEARCGCILVHHTPKPSKERNATGPYDEQYLAYGSSLLSNHVRATVVLKPVNSRGFFELKATKRGERLRWLDVNGEMTFSKFIRHADPGQGIHWQEATPEEVAAELGVELGPDGQPKKGEEDVIRFLQEHDGPVEKSLVAEFLNTNPGKLGINKANGLLGSMVRDKLIFECQLPREGRKAAVGLSLEPAGEADSTP